MVLCIGIVEDGLNRKVISKNYINTDNPFVLERCEIYHGSSVFSTGVLYIVRAEALPDVFSVQDGSALISIGTPPESYSKSLLHLIVLAESTDLIELSNDVHHIFFEYNALAQNLQDSVNKSRSIQYLVEIMAPYLHGNELIVGNAEFRVIAKSNKSVHLFEISGLEQPDENGAFSPENVTFFKNDIINTRALTFTEPFIYEPSIFICRSMCINIFYRGDFACRVIVSEDVNTFRGYEEGLVRFFASFIQLIYDLSIGGNDIETKDHTADIFINLLEGESVEDWKLESSLSKRGWTLPGSFVCANILPSDRDFYNRTIHYYCETFNRDIHGCCFFEYREVIVCVINLEIYRGSLELFFKKHLETFRDVNFRIGYSNKLTDIENLQHYYKQADIALKIGLKVNPTLWFHSFSDIVLTYLESKMTEELDGRYLCEPEILALYDYDVKNQTEFLKTLRIYIDNQMNAIKTASQLYIHISTMKYRLQRIKTLTGFDFKNPAKLLYLSISIKLLFKE